MEKPSWDFSRCHEEWMLTPFGGALPIFPKPDNTATNSIDWWKRCTIGVLLLGANRAASRSDTEPFSKLERIFCLGGTKTLRFGRMETSWSFTSLRDRMASAKRRSHAHFFPNMPTART